MNRFRRQPGRKGFTMIELMVVVIIVGVLAAIAVPLYGKYINNARVTEATGRMGEIITACKAWAQENQQGGVPQWPGNLAANTDLGVIDMQSTENFDYSVASTAGDATTALVVTATGTNDMAGAIITITVPNINARGGAPSVTLP